MNPLMEVAPVDPLQSSLLNKTIPHRRTSSSSAASSEPEILPAAQSDQAAESDSAPQDTMSLRRGAAPLARSQNVQKNDSWGSTRGGQAATSTESEDPGQYADDYAGVETADAEVDPNLCPRCGGKLLNPQELGWCPRCRYCRSLESEQKATNVIEEGKRKKLSPLGIVEFLEFANKLPSWAIILIEGIVVIFVCSLLLNRYFPAEESLARALTSLITYIVSVVTVLVVNFWSIAILAPDDEHLGPKDVFLFGKLWRQVVKHQPEMRWQLWLGAWALTAFACAVLFIRGTDYWLNRHQMNVAVERNQQEHKKATRKVNNRSLSESIDDFAKLSDRVAGMEGAEEVANGMPPPKKEGEKSESKSQTEKLQCMLVGYTATNSEVTSLIVAVWDKSGPRFAGIVPRTWTERQGMLLLAKLSPWTQDKPSVPDVPIRAHWVQPDIYCSVQHQGWDEQRLLNKAEFQDLLLDKVRCKIIGYTLDEDGQLDGLLLGMVLGNRLRYAGIVADGITPETSDTLLPRLKAIAQPESAIPDLQLKAQWVKPDKYCEITQEGLTPENLFKTPRFARVVK